METLCILVQRSPYGTTNAAEAVRHAGGGLNFGVRTMLLLQGDGVYVAKRGQEVEDSGFTSVSRSLEELMKRSEAASDGSEIRCRVVAHAPSVRARGLVSSELVPGVETAESDDCVRLLATADALLVY